MPELPEVETVCRGLQQNIVNQTIKQVKIHQSQLRYKIPQDIVSDLCEQKILAIKRRAKYILVHLTKKILLVHLGMSGTLNFYTEATKRKKHEHVIINFTNGNVLCYEDTRRFGCILYLNKEELINHRLLYNLGIEPLSSTFDAYYLIQQCAKRKQPLKSVLMNSKIVVGIGNIYASEICFLSKISPFIPAQQVTMTQCENIVKATKEVLSAAIHAGGTTLRDFKSSEGKNGYFQQQLHVYGRVNESCFNCQELIVKKVLAQRSTFYCVKCQNVN